MNKSTVLAYLKKNQDPRGIEHWKNRNQGPLKSYGIGLTNLRKYAKSIGRDPKLAKSLWNSNIHEMKTTTPYYEEELHKNRILEDIAAKYGFELSLFNLSEYFKSGALLSCMVMHLNRRSYDIALT